MGEAAGDYAGQDRYECREALIEELKEKKLLSHSDPHIHNVGHCYRCHCVIEPYVSMQWFVAMKSLAGEALEASDDGRVQFVPSRWDKVYRSWLENVRDWCISRQIWWGHRIPAWICSECGEVTVEREDPTQCAACGSADIHQDEDVLDTWFSSALWPFSTLGWPDETPELDYFYPTNVLVTDRGIIYLWVARLVMDGLKMMGQVPFSHVFIHATIQDEMGRKMSKSLGNGIDPIEMIEKYGADALRYALMMLTVDQQDVRLAEKKFEVGRNFANKVWNASRFVLMNLGDPAALKPMPYAAESAALEDRWILSRLGKTLRRVTDALADFRFNEAATAIYDFTWREFCDWYVEIVKPRLNDTGDDGARVRGVLIHALDGIMRMLHPFTPFLTEEIWQQVRDYLPASCMHFEKGEAADALIVAAWPHGADHAEDAEAEATMTLLQGIIRSVREVRSRMNIPDSRPVALVASTDTQADADRLLAHAGMLKTLAAVESLEAGVGLAKPASAASDVVAGVQVYMPLKGLIDLAEERGRLEKRIEETERYLAVSEKKLSNEGFVNRAPADVVEAERERNREAAERLAKLQTDLADLADN